MMGRQFHKCVNLFLLCHIFIDLHSQDRLVFENLTGREKYVLLAGKENVLKFESNIDNIIINSEKILKNGSLFKVKPNQVGPLSLILLSGSTKKGRIDFEVKLSDQGLPIKYEYIARLGSLPEGSNVTAAELLDNLIVKIYRGNEISTGSSIFSFYITYVQKQGDIIEAEHKSAELNKEIIEQIKLAKSGDVAMLENIKIKCQDGTIRRIQGVSYQIK